MLKRTITAVVAILFVFVPVIYFSDTIVFPIAMALMSLIGSYEMMSCVGLKNNYLLLAISMAFGGFLPFIPWFTDGMDTAVITFLSISVYLIVYMVIFVFSKGKTDYSYFTYSFFGVFYTAISFESIVLIRELRPSLYILVFIGPWISDTFAYLCGRLFGRHKLIPEVSPKKTVEGAVGAIVLTAASTILYVFILSKINHTPIEYNLFIIAIVGAVISIISQVGDLTASAIKRKFGIKDYGFLFPGHGGVLDRFDSVVFTAIILLNIILLKII